MRLELQRVGSEVDWGCGHEVESLGRQGRKALPVNGLREIVEVGQAEQLVLLADPDVAQDVRVASVESDKPAASKLLGRLAQADEVLHSVEEAAGLRSDVMSLAVLACWVCRSIDPAGIAKLLWVAKRVIVVQLANLRGGSASEPNLCAMWTREKSHLVAQIQKSDATR